MHGIYIMPILYLKRTLLCIALFCVLCFDFFINEDLKALFRFYEKYNDTPTELHLNNYSAVIQEKPVVGVKNNLSGLTWSGTHGMLFAVVNNPPELLWLTSEGDRIGGMPLSDIADPEAVAWVSDRQFWIGSEKNGVAYRVDVDIERKTLTHVSHRRVETSAAPKNNGLEGLAWLPEYGALFWAKEQKPIIIGRVDIHKTSSLSQRLPRSTTATMRDVSGLHYHVPTSSLLVLSDKSKKILEVSRWGRVRDRLFLKAGESGLKNDIPQAEGIAMDDERNLYIVSEPNLFYLFTPQRDTRAPSI